MKISKRKITAAEEDYIKIGNRILPKNAAGLGYADYDTVSRAGKKAYDAEQEEKRLAAEKEAKRQKAAEAIEAFNAVYPGEVTASNAEQVLDDLFEEFVPGQGPTDSLGAELVRAASRVGYRWFNDGDRFNQGYGLETCGPDAAFLAEYGGDKVERIINDMAERMPDWPEDSYSEAIYKLCAAVVNYLADNLELFGEDVIDSRGYRSPLVDDWEEWSHCLEYEPDTSGEYLDRLIDADLLNWRDVEGFLEDCTSDMGGRVNTWAQDAFTIEDLNQEEWDEWNDNFDAWWNQWLQEQMDENEEALIAYEEGEDEEYDEDEEEEY